MTPRYSLPTSRPRGVDRPALVPSYARPRGLLWRAAWLACVVLASAGIVGVMWLLFAAAWAAAGGE